MAHAGEDVEERAVVGRGKPYTVGGHHRDSKRARQASQRHQVRFFVAQQVPLQLDVDVGAPEQADETVEQPADAVAMRVEQRPPGQCNETGGKSVELLDGKRACPFHRAHLHAGDKATEVAIPLWRGDEHREPPEDGGSALGGHRRARHPPYRCP